MAAPSPPRDAPLRGLAYMIAAAASFTAMNAVTAALGRAGLPWQTTAFARAAVGLLAAVLVARARGASLAVRDRRTMWTRSLAGTGSLLCTFYALTHVPLADATALLNTTPLWTTLLAYITLREAPGRAVLFALALAAAGVVLIEQPSLAVGNLAGLAALAAGALSALAMVSLRRLSGETPEAVVVRFSAVATVGVGVLLAVMMLREGGHPVVTAPGATGLLAIGLAATVGQLFMTRAYALDRAARVGAAGWAQLLLALVADRVVLGRVPPPTTLAGIALMLLGGVVLVASASREMRASSAPARWGAADSARPHHVREP